MTPPQKKIILNNANSIYGAFGDRVKIKKTPYDKIAEMKRIKWIEYISKQIFNGDL